jgi:putative peptidoglycan lipid II flippase
VQLLVAAALLARRIGPGAGAGVGRALLRDLIAVLPACVVGAVLLILLGGTAPGGFALSGIAPAVLSIAVIGGAMSVVYLGGLLALRSPDLRALLAPLLDRSKRH